MNKYDSKNVDKRYLRNKYNLSRANKELMNFINVNSKDIVINVISDTPETYKDEYVVLFKLKVQMTPIQFQTLLNSKLRDLI